MSPQRFALQNPWAVLVGALLVAVLGLRSFFMLPTEYFPDTSRPRVAVVTVEPGAAAGDVGRRITEVIEKEVSGIEGLMKLTSSTRDEVSAVTAEFEYKKAIGEAVVDVQNAISRIRADLPEDILEPRIYRITDATRPVLTLALSPKANTALSFSEIRLLAENDIKDFLLNLSEVADVEVFGANRMQVNIWLDRDRLKACGLTPAEVSAAIKAQNITIPAGLMEGPQGEALVKTSGEFRDIYDLERLVIKHNQAAYILLKDVARIELGTEDARSLYHGNGRQAIAINILRPEGGNTLLAIRSVKKALPDMSARWADIQFDVSNDQEPLIDRNTSGMRSSLYMSIGLTILIIFLFLADVRTSFVALVSIPMSFLFGLAALGFTGYTLNVVTLSGLIIATGMVVDATVVVVENIHRRQRGCDGDTRKCVEDAVGEILTSITAGLLTTVVMLIPIMFAGGYVEKVLRQFTLTLCLALVGSLLVAVFVVPPLSLRVIRFSEGTRNRLERMVSFVGGLVDRLGDGYVRLLRTALRHRLITMLVVLGCFILTIRLVMPIIGRELMPPMDTGISNIVFDLPPFQDMGEMEKTLTEVESILKRDGNVAMISSVVGSEPGQVSFGAGGQTAQTAFMTVNLLTRDERDHSIWEINDLWRKEISGLSGIRSLQVYEYGASPMSTSRAPIDLVLMGRDSKVLWRLGEEISGRMEGMSGLVDLVPGWWMDKKEVDIHVDSRTARLYEITPSAVGDQLRLAINGIPVTGLRLKGFLDVPVRIAYADDWVSTRERLKELDIFTAKGPVPLRTLAHVEDRLSQTVITREDLENTLDLTGYNRTRRISQVLEELGKRMKGFVFPGGYHMKMSGTAADMADSMPRVMKAVMLGLLLLLVLLIGIFQSFILPLPILIAIPLAIMGSLWGLLFLGKPMCMPAMMGIVLLAGIVINNSIFLIDFIKQALKSGMNRTDALEQAVRLRLRPVLMTTISTFVGMIPIIMETAVGLERMSPLGTAAGFGLLAGTVMTLIVTPVTYSLLADAKAFLGGFWKGAQE